ncbi:MAG: hypothetical protein LBD45_04140 [Bacteroidales bacterium]|jgi:hypothetical protein|nr:hypothetical protein [Bacteroidales bacterium]
MQYILQILILFILTGSLLKVSFWKFWQTAVFGLLSAGFVVLTCQWAILQSKTQLADFLGNTTIMQNAAVLITLESVLGIAFCFSQLRAMFGVQKAKWWKRLLNGYPCLLLFPVLFYLQTQLIFALPGVDFMVLSYTLAAMVWVVLPLGARGIAYLIPEKELRMEVFFLVNLFVCILGLIATVNGNVIYSAVKGSDKASIAHILPILAVCIVFFIVGIIVNKMKYTYRNS